MGLIVYPKSWVSGEVLTAADLNAEFAAVTDQVNGNLDDSNVASGANIQGSKIAAAPNGIGTTQLNDGSVTGAKLADAPNGVTTGKINDTQVTGAKVAVAPNGLVSANLNVGATVHAAVLLMANSISQIGGGGPADVVVLPSLTTRGGPVMLLGNVALVWFGAATGMVTLKLYRGVTLLNTTLFPVANATGGTVTTAIPCPQWVDFVAAGSYVYKFTAECDVGTLESSITPGFWFGVELS